MSLPDSPTASTHMQPGRYAIADASPNAIVGVDGSGRIVYTNPKVAEVFGWEPKELIGRKVEELVPHEVRRRHLGHRARFASTPTSRPMGIGLDLAGLRRDGTTFPVEISLAPVTDGGDPVTFATIVDITARKALESQLLQAQKMESVGRLAAGIAHDFNNLLFAIRGYGDMLLEDLDETSRRPLNLAEVRRSVEAMVSAADRASSMTAQLLAFSRRRAIQPVPVRLSDAVGAVEPMLRRLIGERVELLLNLAPDTGVARVDPGQLDQILVNLVVNARDAMLDTGTITIETRNVVFDEPYALEHFAVEPGDYAMVAVTDTGHGMDAETRARVFEPFFTTKEPGKGTGLGLATTYGIVRQAGGHIWLYSEPDRGTTFKVYFPRVDADQQGVSEAPAEETNILARSGSVLLVEDEPAVRDLTRRVLERAGYAVLAPEDPLAALDIIESAAEIDVLVTDLVMPKVSGAEIASRVLESRPRTAVVVMSGYAGDDEPTNGLVARGAVFASKPFGTHDLLRIINEALEQRGLR